MCCKSPTNKSFPSPPSSWKSPPSQIRDMFSIIQVLLSKSVSGDQICITSYFPEKVMERIGMHESGYITREEFKNRLSISQSVNKEQRKMMK